MAFALYTLVVALSGRCYYCFPPACYDDSVYQLHMYCSFILLHAISKLHAIPSAGYEHLHVVSKHVRRVAALVHTACAGGHTFVLDRPAQHVNLAETVSLVLLDGIQARLEAAFPSISVSADGNVS